MAGRKHRPEEIIGNPRSQKIQRQIAEIDTVRQKQRFSTEFKRKNALRNSAGESTIKSDVNRGHFRHISETELDFTSHIYRSDSILRAVHLVVLPRYPDWKPLKLLDLEFANKLVAPELKLYNLRATWPSLK